MTKHAIFSLEFTPKKREVKQLGGIIPLKAEAEIALMACEVFTGQIAESEIGATEIINALLRDNPHQTYTIKKIFIPNDAPELTKKV